MTKTHWKESISSCYNQNYYVVRRYEHVSDDGTRIKLEYSLDPFRSPGRYGRFYMMNISRYNPGEEAAEHCSLTLGPFLEDLRSDEPMILEGGLNFSCPKMQAALQTLILSGAVNREIIWILEDVLKLSQAGLLRKMQLKRSST